MRLAAVLYDAGNGQDVDALLGNLAGTLKCQGWRLAGAVQANEPRAGSCRCDMTLEDLASGRRIRASEDRGSLARGCRLDTYALEDAAGLAISSLAPGVDLVVINRFGKREAEGRGFRPLIEAAVDLDIPVVIGVNQAQCSAWQIFSGGVGRVLEPDAAAIHGWCMAALGLAPPPAGELLSPRGVTGQSGAHGRGAGYRHRNPKVAASDQLG